MVAKGTFFLSVLFVLTTLLQTLFIYNFLSPIFRLSLLESRPLALGRFCLRPDSEAVAEGIYKVYFSPKV
jgi:hypothetical protein